jgi:uncharacterized membrane protein
LAGEVVPDMTRFGLVLWRSLVLLWTAFTVVFLGVISVLIVREPNFPLGITFVDTRGLAGLWITVPSFLLGLFGLLLLLFRRATGAKWLLLYSAIPLLGPLPVFTERSKNSARSFTNLLPSA